MTLLLHQLRFEQRTFWRSKEAAVFIFIFPLLLYALLGSVYDGEIDGEPAVDVLLAGLFGYGAMNTAFGGLAIMLVGRRELGILKRLRSTPLPPGTYLGALLLSTLVIFALQSVALLALGVYAFDGEFLITRLRSGITTNWVFFDRSGVKVKTTSNEVLLANQQPGIASDRNYYYTVNSS